MPRYDNRDILLNNVKAYRDHFKNRGVNFIEQYETPEIKYPSREEILGLLRIPHTWSLGDRFYKLAHQHYNKPELWWVIAWFNLAPTESHLTIGDVIYIPKPLEMIIDLFQED
tara:strand:+ start:7068 stop:7406 length:339 start_codon:yes stop_codon:yes gene_type:complete